MNKQNKVILLGLAGFILLAFVFVNLRGSGSSFPGIYTGLESSFGFQPNAFAPGGGNWSNTLTYYHWVFLSDGRFYTQLPSYGDLAGFCDSDDGKGLCGTYQIAPDQLSIRRFDGSEQSYKLVQNSAGGYDIQFKLNVVLRKAVPYSGRLEGTWHRTSYTPVYGPAGNIGVSGDRQITFHSDGTFEASHFTGFSGSGPYAGVYGNLGDDVKGMYSINGYTLEFTFDNGDKVQHTFFQYPGEDTISIDGASFIR